MIIPIFPSKQHHLLYHHCRHSPNLCHPIHLISVPLSVFKDKPPVKLTQENMRFMKSVQPKLHPSHGCSSHIFLVTGAITHNIFAPSPSVTHTAPLSAFERISIREPFWSNFSLCYPGATHYTLQSSFPIMWPGFDTGSCLCTSQIKSTYFLSSYSLQMRSTLLDIFLNPDIRLNDASVCQYD